MGVGTAPGDLGLNGLAVGARPAARLPLVPAQEAHQVVDVLGSGRVCGVSGRKDGSGCVVGHGDHCSVRLSVG
ncbi:hypothetical protein [Ornithinimicrobium kibberense]|uniref:hypothetical protein n=1 Tax=Ornithinimicrobium kibberense TaxID=282060 RepID=UPI0036075CA0